MSAIEKRLLVTVDGPDAAKYLQGQLSADVNRLSLGASAWSLLLEPTGKLGTLLRIAHVADGRYELDCDVDATVEPRLRRFLIRTKATISVSTVLIDVDLAEGADGRTLVGWWGEGEHRVVHAGAPDPAAVAARRVHSGWPGAAELSDGVIPGETGVVSVAASFTKGCYTGQELVARIDSRANNTPRHLRAVRLTGAAEAGDAVKIGDDQVGTLTSVADFRGLAYIARRVDTLPAAATVNALAATIVEQRS